MDCKTAQSLVIPYINDQLSDEETEDFLEHIENCKSAMRNWRSILRFTMPYRSWMRMIRFPLIFPKC